MTKKLEDILNLPNVKEAFKEVDKRSEWQSVDKKSRSTNAKKLTEKLRRI